MEELVTLDNVSTEDIFPNVFSIISAVFQHTDDSLLFELPIFKLHFFCFLEIVMIIVIIITNSRSCDFVIHSYDFRPNWTPLSPITIIYDYYNNYYNFIYAYCNFNHIIVANYY